MRDPWNINIHYDALLDRSVPASAASVLDVGCGDGLLSARLSRRVPYVVGLDVDAAVLERARQRFPDAPVHWCCADVYAAELEPGSFDAVVSNAALHHLGPTATALRRMAGLVRPGGVLNVVTFTRTDWRELPWWAVAFVARGVVQRVRGNWQHSATISWPPPDTYREFRDATAEALGDARVSRLLYGRCLVRWQRPYEPT